MQQHDLRPNPGAKTDRRRIGRGTGSGQGTTAGKGTKGQQARSGLTRRGFEGVRSQSPSACLTSAVSRIISGSSLL